MDHGVRNELPKLGQDTRYLLEHQRLQRDSILKECDEYEQRATFLKNKIKEIEENIFNTPMGERIKELVKENLSLSIDAQCLSIELDIYNQGMDRAVSESNNFYRNSPSHGSPNHHPMAPMAMMNRANTPTSSNVVTLDTTSYPYAQVVSPYPVQPGMPTLPYPMTGNMVHHLSPHQHPQETARQLSMPMGPHPGHPIYNFHRSGSVSILNQVPPPGWMQQANYPVSPTVNPGPPVPPRPSELHIPTRNRPGRSLPTPPQRPVPPPPTPPRTTRSPNLERPRSSNDIIDQREEDENHTWQCSQCTFRNHSAMNACEMCSYSRVGSLGNIYSTFGELYSGANPKKSPGAKHKHHKGKKRTESSSNDRRSGNSPH